MASECTQRAVHEFLAERGGRVQQMELMDHFLSARADDGRSREGVDRELLERAVASVGLVEVGEDGVKFVRLRAEVSAGADTMRADTGGRGREECNGNAQEAPRDDNNGVNGNPDSRGQTGERNGLWVGLIMKHRRIYRFMASGASDFLLSLSSFLA